MNNPIDTEIEVKTKTWPKMEDISACLVEADEAEIERVVKDCIDIIYAKREVKIRKYLKRTAGDSGEIEQKSKK
jgi:hypothetical protein